MGRIEWTGESFAGERGRVDGHDVFHLSYPGDWSEGFILTSPLIFIGERYGWLGTIELPGPGPETRYGADERPSRTQIVADFEADKERWNAAKSAAKAMAESLLIDFARSVLRGVDEPSQIG